MTEMMQAPNVIPRLTLSEGANGFIYQVGMYPEFFRFHLFQVEQRFSERDFIFFGSAEDYANCPGDFKTFFLFSCRSLDSFSCAQALRTYPQDRRQAAQQPAWRRIGLHGTARRSAVPESIYHRAVYVLSHFVRYLYCYLHIKHLRHATRKAYPMKKQYHTSPFRTIPNSKISGSCHSSICPRPRVYTTGVRV